MSDNTLREMQARQEPGYESGPKTSLLTRLGLFVLFLVCSLAIFLFGPNYYKLFPTNGNWVYAAVVSAVFLLVVILFKRTTRLAKFRLIAYAFFVAAMVNLVSDLFAGYNQAVLRFLGTPVSSNMELAVAKLYDAVLVVVPILVLTLLSGADLRSLFLGRGNNNRKWNWGLGALILVNYLTSALIFFGTGYSVDKLGPVVLCGLVFSFSNSLLEELWVRGLFLKKLVPLTGVAGTVLLSSIWFASLHFLSVAYLPAAVVPIFVVNTFTLGLACAILMWKTDSIWGAFLLHAANDLFLFIATLAVH
jgi:membrane protease YdiL (CAAX protease family)